MTARTRPDAPAAVSVRGLRHRYGEREAVAGIDLDVPAGTIFGLLGPNGGGKTTLFRILATLLAPTEGAARIFGHDVRADASAVRRRMGIVFQSPSLDRKLSVMENLVHQGHLYGLRGAALRDRAHEVLARVDLETRRDDRVETLSGGQRRRVEIAKGLLHRPALLLLDEPSTGLDPRARRDVWEHLEELRGAEGITVVLTTHLMGEAETCDRLGILHRGRLVALGTPDELKQEIGGDVITIETPNPAKLAEEVRIGYGAAVQVVGRTLRIERARAHAFVAELAERFGDELGSVTVGKPTLEDVFIHRTGTDFFAAGDGRGEGGER